MLCCLAGTEDVLSFINNSANKQHDGADGDAAYPSDFT
jgi:hypothetical protein